MTQPPDSSTTQLYTFTRPPNPSVTFLNFYHISAPMAPRFLREFRKIFNSQSPGFRPLPHFPKTKSREAASRLSFLTF